ncbi:hypothetical protein [Ramlibacter humi]|uniref:Uncharacterized protein n=1 Tax=Ramlibacter humi TaxID=2530451 RepID=A0A4Z0BZM3_9BURK|nr:hypothetical protein [Ramlibacter humi]TFZ03758.1 hypothetical protein EZ216_08875 [Ramlibacter humi]
MKDQAPVPEPGNKEEPKARHGYRNEVNWEGGSGRQAEPPMGHARVTGRQPYSNQGSKETPGTASAGEVPEGNRGEQSGNSLEQLEKAKTRP